MNFGDWHHGWRLDADTDEQGEHVIIFKADAAAPFGQKAVTVCSPDEALALGDMLRLWAQGAMARKDSSRG